eukprot:Pompholyxophrys_sp_v1_NODE_142_length_1604_cov_1.602970.p1 type:complete len:296 gc:universal NODE_142_length_1604_cov_1.602970:1111-224(-)
MGKRGPQVGSVTAKRRRLQRPRGKQDAKEETQPPTPEEELPAEDNSAEFLFFQELFANSLSLQQLKVTAMAYYFKMQLDDHGIEDSLKLPAEFLELCAVLKNAVKKGQSNLTVLKFSQYCNDVLLKEIYCEGTLSLKRLLVCGCIVSASSVLKLERASALTVMIRKSICIDGHDSQENVQARKKILSLYESVAERSFYYTNDGRHVDEFDDVEFRRKCTFGGLLKSAFQFRSVQPLFLPTTSRLSTPMMARQVFGVWKVKQELPKRVKAQELWFPTSFLTWLVSLKLPMTAMPSI